MSERLRRLPLSLLIACLLATAAPLRADLWYEHYTRAEKALARESWAEAVDELNEALAKKGDSGARARTYGMKFYAYFPYLRLGIAYHHLGQYDAALQAFETEERLGAIAQSEPDAKELERYRTLTLEAQRQARQTEEARVESVVEEGLATAARLEREGEIEGAVAALGEALAVAPDNAQALAVLDRLRGALADLQRAEDLRARSSAFVENGRSLLGERRYAEAASALRQALALVDDPAARALLEEAQQGLLEESRELEERQRVDLVEKGLAEARAERAAGRTAEALELLQRLRALAPSNQAVLELERALLVEQTRAGEERLIAEAVEGYIAEAESALGAGRFEVALAAANRVLAVSPGNAAALDQLARAYRGVSRRLLGDSPVQNFPPAIRFADQRQQLDDGTLVERVDEPLFRLTGVVIDDSEVEIEFFDEKDRPLGGSASAQALGDLFITEFQLDHRLPAGPSALRLVATDTGSLTSSAEYEVIYRRPLMRSPWFYGLLGVLSVTVAAVAGVSRVRRHRRLHRRRFNPYVAGAPVLDETLFFGRERLLERVLETLHNNSLLLYGERRIGKTTLQHQLKRRLEGLEDPAYDFYPVYVDLQGTPESRFFATLAEEIFDELAPVLDDLEPCKPSFEGYGYRDLVRDLRAVLKALHGRGAKGVRLVLLIDEVDELNAYDPKINQKLRSLFMKSFAEDLVAVVSGVSIKREWDREGSPWYNFFEEIDVGPFLPEDARELVEAPTRGFIRFDDSAVARILELAGGRPYRIQKLCMKLVSRMHESGRRDVTAADVDEIGELTRMEAS